MAVFLSVGWGGEPPATAAVVLHKAAAAALADDTTLRPGEYVYTRSVDAYLSTTVYAHERSYTVLVPHLRETWLGPDGTGWLHETSGRPTFPSERDREDWIAAGRPELAEKPMDVKLANDDGPTPPMASLELPTDPDALYAELEKEAGDRGSRVYVEVFKLIGDDLRESYTTPAQRAALFEVAARLPGITSLGVVTDPAGRAGVGVAMDDPENTLRGTLIFDRDTYALLAEEETVLAGNRAGYPAGTVIGHATYLARAVVGSLKERPASAG